MCNSLAHCRVVAVGHKAVKARPCVDLVIEALQCHGGLDIRCVVCRLCRVGIESASQAAVGVLQQKRVARNLHLYLREVSGDVRIVGAQGLGAAHEHDVIVEAPFVIGPACFDIDVVGFLNVGVLAVRASGWRRHQHRNDGEEN